MAAAPALLVVFGAMLTALTALMGWQAVSVISAGRSIAVLESLLKDIADDLKATAADLKKIDHHAALIMVLENKVGNLKAETDLCFQKIKDIEREKVPLHRR